MYVRIVLKLDKRFLSLAKISSDKLILYQASINSQKAWLSFFDILPIKKLTHQQLGKHYASMINLSFILLGKSKCLLPT